MLDAIRHGWVEPVTSWDLAQELVDVLRRPRLRRYGLTDEEIQEFLVLLGPWLPSVDVAVEIRDPDDAAVVAAAIAGRAEAIVTGDRYFLDDAVLGAWLEDRQIAVLSPAQLLVRLKR